MKRKKKTFPMRTTLLLLLMMLTSLSVWANETFTVGDLTYIVVSESSKTVNVRNYSGTMPENYNMVIPASVTNPNNSTLYTVIGIEISAFMNKTNLTSVSIPASMTRINQQAFEGCTNLETVSIPEANGVTDVGDAAFSGTKWLNDQPNGVVYVGKVAYLGKNVSGDISINDGAVSISDEAFLNCTGLTSVTIPNSVTYIGSSAFGGCTNLTSITIPNGVTEIGGSAFSGSGLISITIPNSVTFIDDGAFYKCTNLKTVTIYAPSCFLGNDDAFSGCNDDLQIYVFSDLVNTYKGAEDWSKYAGIIKGLTGGYCGKDDPATGVDESKNVVWVLSGASPNYTLTISGTGKMASYSSVDQYPWNDYRSSITSLVFESGVTSVCDGAFSGYSNLTSVTFQQGVETIGHSAFSSCSGLKSISIPNSVTTIYSGAFSGCTNVETLELGSGLTTIEAGVFSGLTSLTSLTIGDGVKTIYAGAFSGCTGLKNLTIGDGVTSIAYVFNDCTNLETIVLGAGLTFLNAGSFDGYTKLKSVTFKNGTSPLFIYEAVFRGCTSLETVTLPNNVTQIGTNAFSGCTSLTSMNIPASVTSIGESVFYNCTNLTSVALNGPTTIGSGAFPSNTTVTIASGLYLHNGSEVLCGDVTDMSKLNSKTLQKAVKITLPTGIIASGTNVFNQSDGTYALPNATVTIAADTNYKISNVDATGADLTNNGDGTYTFTVGTTDVTVTATVLTNVVTPSNFSSYFDANGELLDEITFDELIFQGEFSNLVSYITLDRPITITGDNAVLNNMGFIIAGNDVTLDNLTLVANNNLGNLIDIAGENATISNNTITYVVDEAASVINVYSGANGVQILKNTIYFESTVDDYAANDVTTAICVNSGISIFDDEVPITGLVIDGNKITAVIPAFLADIYENEYYVMGISAVNGVRINGAEDFKFTNNTLDVTTNWLYRTTPTFQAMYVASSSGLIDGNDISMIDIITPSDKDVYLYALELINDEDLTISNNNFNLSTTGGKEEAGAANAIIAIASDFSVVGNNITTASKGPNVGIYFPSMMGAPCDAVINGNIIKVTGLATAAHNTGLVSGIEIQTGCIEMSGNTIYTYNIDEYAEGNYIYGISYAQYGTISDVEITNNTVITEGRYAISFFEVDDAVITGNTFSAHELYGDDAVDIQSGDNNTVENNLLGYVMPTTGESTYNIPANVSSFKVYDDGGQGYRYSSGCTGTLVLTAPAGYSLQLSGSIKTEKDVDYLTVYDGSDNQADVLIDQVSSSVNGTETAIPTVTSTGNVMTIYFYSDNSGSDKTEFDGLDLTVTVTAPSTFVLTANLAEGSYWTSFYFGGVSYKIDESEDATAYTATRSGDKLTLTSIGKNIPKNTAVIIKGTDNSISLTRDDNITDYTGDNELQGVNYETPQEDGYTYYVLSKKGDNFGFFKLASSKQLGAHKAYLEVDAQNSTREFFGFEEDDATGLTPNPSPVGEGSWYNLNGQKLSKPQKGINIANGKKVLY